MTSHPDVVVICGGVIGTSGAWLRPKRARYIAGWSSPDADDFEDEAP